MSHGQTDAVTVTQDGTRSTADIDHDVRPAEVQFLNRLAVRSAEALSPAPTAEIGAAQDLADHGSAPLTKLIHSLE